MRISPLLLRRFPVELVNGFCWLLFLCAGNTLLVLCACFRWRLIRWRRSQFLVVDQRLFHYIQFILIVYILVGLNLFLSFVRRERRCLWRC